MSCSRDDSKSEQGLSSAMVVVVGSANVDLILKVDHIPRPGESILAGALTRGMGGKGANQAIACARDGASVSFVGAVGTDSDGQDVRRHLADEGVDISRLRDLGSPTGIAIVSVGNDAENSIIVAPGANYGLIGLQDADRLLIQRAAVVLLQLELPMQTIVDAAAAASGTVVLNAAPARDLPDTLLAHVDVVVVNESEAVMLADRLDGVPVVITTMGANGVRMRSSDGTCQYVDGRTVVAIDTTAAGDTFCGVLCAQLARAASWDESLRRANAAASIAVQREGAQASIPTAGETNAVVQQYPG